MRRSHALVVSIVLGAAVFAGVLAITRTVSLGQHAAAASAARIRQRSAQLDRLELAIRRARAEKPPPLPTVPVAAARARPVQRVVYRRPAPIVIHVPRRHEEDDRYEAQSGELAADD